MKNLSPFLSASPFGYIRIEKNNEISPPVLIVSKHTAPQVKLPAEPCVLNAGRIGNAKPDYPVMD